MLFTIFATKLIPPTSLLKIFPVFSEPLNLIIELSTIHAAKGGEAENVVLLTDLTENTMRSYERNPDDENRLFYVGATRTKENLHLVEPKKYEKGYIL